MKKSPHGIFTKVMKSLIKSRKSGTLAVDLHESVQAAIDILNKMDGVEVDRPFWNDSKPMQWLKMPEASCLS